MPSVYPAQILSKVYHSLVLLSNLANEPLTAEEQRYYDEHKTFAGTSFSALFRQLDSLITDNINNVFDEGLMKLPPHCADSLTKKGSKLIYIEDDAEISKADALCKTIIKRCAELKTKPSTGPNTTALLDYIQGSLEDMMDGRDVSQERSDDPLYLYAGHTMTDLNPPVAGSENAEAGVELMEMATYRFPLNRMLQYGLDVHRKIRDFRERIDPTDQEACDTAKESLRRTLDEYEEVTLRLLRDTDSPSHAKERDLILQQNTWKLDILGDRGFRHTILPLIRDYKEGLSLGIDPALLPQYALMKQAVRQLDEPVKTLRKENKDGRYNKVLKSAEQFRTAFQSLMTNKDPARTEKLMEGVCSAMNELYDSAGEVFKAHKKELTDNLINAITGLRGTDLKYLEGKSAFNTFRHITKTVEDHYEKRHQLENAPRTSYLREKRSILSGLALQDDKWVSSDRQDHTMANLLYLDKKYYGQKHEQSIEGGVYDSVFRDEHLFKEDFSFYYPRLANRFPDLANPDIGDKDKVSVLRSAAGHYLDILEEIVRRTSEKMIETRHFVINGKLLTDKKKIAELVAPDNASNNPLYPYWEYIKDARAGLKNAESIQEIGETTRNLTDSFKFIQKHQLTHGDPDIAAAIKVQMDHDVGELKIFAGPPDYDEFFRRRVKAIGTHCREENQAREAVQRLCDLTRNWLDPASRKDIPLTEEDLPKVRAMADIAAKLKQAVEQQNGNTVNIGNRNYFHTAIDLPTEEDPNGKIGRFLENYNSLSPQMKTYCGNSFREADERRSMQAENVDPIKNHYFGEDELRLVSPENVDRFCKLFMEANEARSRLFDHQEFRNYRDSLQAVYDYAETVKQNPGSTAVIFHMAQLMRNAGSAAEAYLLEKGVGKRSSETGNIRYNNAYAALYLTAPEQATGLAQAAKNLHVSADRTKDRQKREYLSLESLMREEFGRLDRTYKKSENGPGYEKVQPAPEKRGKKK